jgi:hypothetical protein
MSAKRALNEFRAPEETAAEERAWSVVRSVQADAVRPLKPRAGWRVATVPILAVVVAALALSPAGATVRRWISGELGVRQSAPALFSLPARGRVLISGRGGTWIVNADGSARRVGSWRQASWSPHGWYLAVAGRDELAAVDPSGTPQWTLARRAVSDPEWYYPTGYRIAYLSGSELRVVVGDGADDHLVASGAASVAPAWRPGHPYEIAYLSRRGVLAVREADTGRLIWKARAPGARTLAWSGDGSRLVVLSRARVTVYAAGGTVTGAVSMPAGAPLVGGSLSPDGHRLALLRAGGADDVVLARLDSPAAPLRRVFWGAGLGSLAWSPNGRWLLVSWPAANQWVFVRVAGRPRIAAVSRIAQQFATRARGSGFPQLEGWCCSAP